MKKYTLQIDTRQAEHNLQGLIDKLGQTKGAFDQVTQSARAAGQAAQGVRAPQRQASGGGAGGAPGAGGSATSAAAGNAGKSGGGAAQSGSGKMMGRVGAGAFGGGLFSFAGVGVSGPAALGLAAVTGSIMAGLRTAEFIGAQLNAAMRTLTGGFGLITEAGGRAATAIASLAKTSLEYQATLETAIQMWTAPFAARMGGDFARGGAAAGELLERVRQYAILTPMTLQQLIPGMNPLQRTDYFAGQGTEGLMRQGKIGMELWSSLGGKVPLERILRQFQRLATMTAVGRPLYQLSAWGVDEASLARHGVTWDSNHTVELEKMGGGNREAGRARLIEAVNAVIMEKYAGTTMLQSSTMVGMGSTALDIFQQMVGRLGQGFTGKTGEKGMAHDYLAMLIDKLEALAESPGWQALGETLSKLLQITSNFALSMMDRASTFLNSPVMKEVWNRIAGFAAYVAGVFRNLFGADIVSPINTVVEILGRMFSTFVQAAPALARAALASMAFNASIENIKDTLMRVVAWVFQNLPLSGTAEKIARATGINPELLNNWTRMKEGMDPEVFRQRQIMREQGLQAIESLIPMLDRLANDQTSRAHARGFYTGQPQPYEGSKWWRDLQAQFGVEQFGMQAGQINEAEDALEGFTDSLEGATEASATLMQKWNELAESWNKKGKNAPYMMQQLGGEFWGPYLQNYEKWWLEAGAKGQVQWEPDTLKRQAYYQQLAQTQDIWGIYGPGIQAGQMYPMHWGDKSGKVSIPWSDVSGGPAKLELTIVLAEEAQGLIALGKVKTVAHPALTGAY